MLEKLKGLFVGKEKSQGTRQRCQRGLVSEPCQCAAWC